jgi:hypothetical protein
VDSEAAKSRYRQFFEHFRAGKTIPIRGSFTHNGETLTIAARPCTADQLKRHFSKSPFLQAGDAVLEFSANFEFPGQEKYFWTDHSGARIKRTTEQSVANWRASLSHDLELTVQTYFCALAIAYEGAVRPTRGIWILDGSNCRVDRCYLSEIHESVEFLRKENAFPEIDLEVNAVINWTFAQNGMFDGYSDTSASRALNYFTRLFVGEFRNDELSNLVWALAGIEALVVESGRSSIGQLKEKLGALFAEKIDLRWLAKMIADSYNFRSRMIHGDRQIRSFFRSNEDENKKRLDESTTVSCLQSAC